MPDLKALLFDVDDTLFSTTKFAHRARRNSVSAMIDAGLDLPEEQVFRELEEVIREFSSNYGHHYDKLLQRLPIAAYEGVNPALVVSAGVIAYHDTKFRGLKPFEDVIPFLEACAAAGLRLGVVTHGWTAKQAEKLIRLDLVTRFDPGAIFISDQVGISKPNPKLYALALREMGLAASEVMMVGDNPANDIAPPLELGMHATWVKRAAKPGLSAPPETDHIVDDFRELATILRDQYEVPIADF